MKMTKITGAVVGLLLLASPLLASADTASTSVSAQVQALLAQIQTLQTQIQAIRAAQTQLVTAQASASTTLGLIRNLRQGMSGDDVAALQAVLAADPSIYPSGIISGFYGSLTAEAVRKFQKKNGFEAVGFVGPKTLKKLNEAIHELGLSHEDNDNATSTANGNGEHGNKLCIPPGHMIAPGWLKKNDKPAPTSLIPLCNQRGDDHNGNNNQGSTTPQLTTNASPSVIVGGNIYDTAHLSFGNNPTGTIAFQVFGPGDTSCAIPLTPALAPISINGNGNYNSLNFTATTTGTYKFIAIYSGDSKNNSVRTNCNDANESVAVTAVPDTTAPVISDVFTSNTTASTTSITWTTNELATSKMWYGTTSPVVLGSSNLISSDAFVTTHTGSLLGLASSTTYNYIVVSADSFGNTATSSQGSFITTAGL